MADNVINMSDQDILQDFLSTAKQVTGTYNIWAGECVNTDLRDEFLCILKEEHEIQSELFKEMQSRGWYQTKPADCNDIKKLKEKYGCC